MGAADAFEDFARSLVPDAARGRRPAHRQRTGVVQADAVLVPRVLLREGARQRRGRRAQVFGRQEPVPGPASAAPPYEDGAGSGSQHQAGRRPPVRGRGTQLRTVAGEGDGEDDAQEEGECGLPIRARRAVLPIGDAAGHLVGVHHHGGCVPVGLGTVNMYLMGVADGHGAVGGLDDAAPVARFVVACGGVRWACVSRCRSVQPLIGSGGEGGGRVHPPSRCRPRPPAARHGPERAPGR